MPDQIIIADLEVACRIGITEAERAHPQRLLLTVEMEHDLSAAVAADDISKTINYDEVSRRLIQTCAGKQWQLIETLASDLANLILRDFKCAGVSVEVKKFVIPQARYVSVRLTRMGESTL